MFFRLIWRLVKEHLGIHYIWPLVVALVVESGFAWAEQGGSGWVVLKEYWVLPAHWAGLASVYLTFIVIIAIYLKKAADVRSTLVQTLDDILPEAATYVGIGTIPLRQWFEPDSLVYLATIIHFQFSADGLNHRRILMFYSDRDLEALKASYLDEHYARCFLAIHKRLAIPLGYVGPIQIQKIILSLSEDSRRLLGCYRRLSLFVRRLSPRSFEAIPISWRLRPRPRLLPFAFIQMKDGKQRVVRFSKGETILRLDEVHDGTTITACTEFVSLLEREVYVMGTDRLKHEFNFDRFVCP